MAQASFAIENDDDDAGDNRAFNSVKPLPLAISIFADRAYLRDEIREDALAAGLRVGQCGALTALLENEAVPLGEAVMLDCPQVDAATLAALSRLDMRAARAGVQMVVSTSVDALDDVFACLDQSAAQILVDPPRAERLVALGRMLGGSLANGPARLREMSEEDRLALLRLTEQVERLAQKLQGNRFEGAVWESGRHAADE
ncbi:MAG: MarR family transcriptional regulator, partial [Proteobacteria bacterium]